MGYCFLYKRGGGGGGSNRPVVVKTALGSVISLTDSTNGKLKGLRIYGKTTQNGTPSPASPVPLESVGDDGNVTVFVGKSQTDSNPQTATFDTPNGLHGYRVASGGNYTDKTGQMWRCDEIDGARGVRVQRTGIYVFDGSDDEKWKIEAHRRETTLLNSKIKPSDVETAANIICSALPTKTAEETYFKTMGISVNSSGSIHCYVDAYSTSDVSPWKSYLAENPMTVIYELATPIETPMAAEELAQYAALHTNYLNTTIFNDEGADMEVKYTSGG